jgi:hypothetical protein
LQENASRYSCVQWSHRTRATPRARSPQSRNVVHDLRDDGAQEPVTGLRVLLIAGETRSEVPGQALPERRDLRRAGTIDVLHHAAQCREEGVSSHGHPKRTCGENEGGIEATGQAFTRPADFNPETYARQAFGIVGGEEPIKVRLLFEPKLAVYITERQWHPSQEFRARMEGRVEMRLETTGRKELVRWVLSWMPDVRVLARRAYGTGSRRNCGMDSGHRNETRWPNHTLLTYTLPADGQGEGERGRSARLLTRPVNARILIVDTRR